MFDLARFMHLTLFVLGVVLFMFGSIVGGFLEEATEPRLYPDLLTTGYKPLHTQYKLYNQPIMTEPVPHSELDFAFLDIVNNPKNRVKGQTAEKVRAQLIFRLKDGTTKRIKYGRWCNEEMPLFQPPASDKSLRQVDIDPGTPETLVIAFKKKHGKNIYAFYYTDHKRTATKKDIDELCKERLIGTPPIYLQVKLDGKFEPKDLDLEIDVDKKGEFVICKKKKMKW